MQAGISFKEKLKSSILMKRPFEDTLHIIDELDLDFIQKKLCSPFRPHGNGYGWPEEGAKKAILSYKEFLKLAAKSRHCAITDGIEPEEVPIQSADKTLPAEIVDIVWHTHILFTQQYYKDCKKIFGFYLHHQPNVEIL